MHIQIITLGGILNALHVYNVANIQRLWPRRFDRFLTWPLNNGDKQSYSGTVRYAFSTRAYGPPALDYVYNFIFIVILLFSNECVPHRICDLTHRLSLMHASLQCKDL